MWQINHLANQQTNQQITLLINCYEIRHIQYVDKPSNEVSKEKYTFNSLSMSDYPSNNIGKLFSDCEIIFPRNQSI
jgi:hypothetical protein